jgi:predicted nucleotidyltransferase
MLQTQAKNKKIYQRKIQEITQQIVKKYKPEKIILFGSFAYGKPKLSSDVDLMIIKKTKKRLCERIKEVLFMIDSSLPLDVLVYTPKEFQRELELGEFIFDDIYNKGKVLYEQK